MGGAAGRADGDNPFVSRGGLKLAAALDAFGVDPAGLVCADLGCSTGGFTDCLLQRGAFRVYAVDTAYGELAWKLRSNERVTVLERTNALHIESAELVDLVVLDLGWTRQSRAIPAAVRWLRPSGRIISLVKPHYELDRVVFKRESDHGVLPEALAQRVADETIGAMAGLGVRVLGSVKSPILGGKRARMGNAEWLVLVEPMDQGVSEGSADC